MSAANRSPAAPPFGPGDDDRDLVRGQSQTGRVLEDRGVVVGEAQVLGSQLVQAALEPAVAAAAAAASIWLASTSRSPAGACA